VRAEAHVLDGDHGVDQDRCDLFDRDRMALAVADEFGQASAVRVDDDGRSVPQPATSTVSSTTTAVCARRRYTAGSGATVPGDRPMSYLSAGQGRR
jgi:hypothetical protein